MDLLSVVFGIVGDLDVKRVVYMLGYYLFLFVCVVVYVW